MQSHCRFGVTGVVASSLFFSLFVATAGAGIINVPGDQATIQAGINAAVNGDEVVLADGTYTGAGNVNCSFLGKLITVRSASGNPEACIIDCQSVANTRGFSFENSEPSGATLSGVTIQNGNHSTGGGAVFISGTAGATLTNCRFISNTSVLGGGVYETSSGVITFDGCDFVGNMSLASGGALNGGNVTIHACRFVDNSADQRGGAMSVNGTNTIVNSLFNNNSAGTSSGAINPIVNSSLHLYNCTLVANIAHGTSSSDGGGAVWASGNTTVTVANSIVLDNVPDQFYNNTPAQTIFDVTYSNIEDGWPGLGNISDGALFMDQNGVDQIQGTIDDDLSLRFLSPCADSGNNALIPPGVMTDLLGNPRRSDSAEAPDTGTGKAPIVDMGCYEYQPAVIGPKCLADIVNSATFQPPPDGVVDGADLAFLLGAWGACQ